jgi:MFS family permease
MSTLPSARQPEAAAGPPETCSDSSKHAVRGAIVGFLIDNFDIYLPVVALAPAITYFLAPDLGVQTIALVTSWIFVATLVGRPLGALIFGWLADTIGRRRATIIAVSGFGATTLAIGVLPGYATWGIGAVVALVALRFVDGMFLGGGYTGASPLAMESVPAHRRGVVGGLIQSGANVAYAAIALLTVVMLAIFPPGGPDSAYSQIGWRVPFLVGAVFALLFAVHYARTVEESEAWKEARDTRTGGAAILQKGNLRSLLQVFVWMTGVWLCLNSITALIPATLRGSNGLAATQVTWTLVVLYVVLTFVFVGGALLSQRIGRRPYLIIASLVATVPGAAAYAWLVGTGPAGPVHAGLITVVVGVLVMAPVAVVTVYINERFTTEARGLGFGLGYSLAVVLPSFYATYQGWLSNLMPAAYTVVVLVVLGGLFQLVGALLGPETKHVQMGPSTTRESS